MLPTLLLVNPPSRGENLANREGTAGYGTLSTGFLYPPHTLATIAAACREKGFPVTVLDAVAEKLEIDSFLARIRANRPDVVGVFSSWATLNADSAALTALHRAFPQTPLLTFGAGIRYSADELLVAGATHVLLGDPDLAVAALLQNPLPSPGLIRVRDILPSLHNHAGLIRFPARLPRPAWDLAPWQKYGFLTVFGSRGCDDRCKYCAYVVAHGHAYRPRPPKDVAAEMIWLEQSFHPYRIMIRDPVFAVDRARTLQLVQALRQANFHTPWECESRPEHFDTALLRKMAAAGCTVIKLGVESAHPQLLSDIGRITEPREAASYLAYIRRVVSEARRYGIRTRAFVMVGLPGQTDAHVQATAAYLRQLRPTFIHARPYVAYPRVPLGQAQTAAQIQALLPPLQAVVEEAQAAAQRKAHLWQRVRQRLLRFYLHHFA